ncbi:MAG: hypothetical protein LBE20_01620 [Deltaproteobacteria bacterium]|nr:hypothetical protein [Deltaproteobacteria bacterium]
MIVNFSFAEEGDESSYPSSDIASSISSALDGSSLGQSSSETSAASNSPSSETSAGSSMKFCPDFSVTVPDTEECPNCFKECDNGLFIPCGDDCGGMSSFSSVFKKSCPDKCCVKRR